MFERFNDQARQVVVRSQEESRALCHGHIGTEHVLLGIVGAPDSPAVAVLANVGVTPEAVRTAVLAALPPGQVAASGHIPFTPSAKKALELSLRAAVELSHNYIGAEHLLLGVLRTDDGAAAILTSLGVNVESVQSAIAALEPPAGAPSSLFDDLKRIEAKVDALTLLVQAMVARLPPDAPGDDADKQRRDARARSTVTPSQGWKQSATSWVARSSTREGPPSQSGTAATSSSTSGRGLPTTALHGSPTRWRASTPARRGW
jgi:ATP-dependent Clp protease ATP-binding subunit ClpC